jgi:hypothetical protein
MNPIMETNNNMLILSVGYNPNSIFLIVFILFPKLKGQQKGQAWLLQYSGV